MDVTSLRFPWSFSQFIYISQSLSERKSVPAASTACSQALEKERFYTGFWIPGPEQGRKVLALIKGYEHPHFLEIRLILIIYILQSVFQIFTERCLEILKAHTHYFPSALPQQNKYRQEQKALAGTQDIRKIHNLYHFCLVQTPNPPVQQCNTQKLCSNSAAWLRFNSNAIKHSDQTLAQPFNWVHCQPQ